MERLSNDSETFGGRREVETHPSSKVTSFGSFTMSKVESALQIYEDRGLQNLTFRFLDHIAWRTKTVVNKAFTEWARIVKGRQEFEVNGVSVEFESSGDEGDTTLRGLLNIEYELLEDLLENIEEGDVFYDVGANIGLHSRFAGQICSEVVAFEPYPPNYDRLKKNLSTAPSNVETFQLALSDAEGEVRFSASDGVGQETGVMGSGERTINTARGDEVIAENGLKQPDIVKIDVEGAEGLVLSGMSNALANARRVYCEIHLPADQKTSIESYDWTPMELLKELESLGFEINFLKQRGRELQIVGEK